VYGSLLVTSLVAVESLSDEPASFVGLSILVSVGVFWIAHVWSGLVDIRLRGAITRAEAANLAAKESPMLLATLPPIAALATTAVGLTTLEQAESLALAVAVVQLFLWGLAVGRAGRRGWGPALVVAAVDLVLGLAIVWLKVAVGKH
jgi:hypothetical protein